MNPVIEEKVSGQEALEVARSEHSSPPEPSTVWLLWEKRRIIARFGAYGFVLFTLIAFLLPRQYRSTTRIMPPDTPASGALAMVSALAGGGGGAGLGMLAGNLLGIKSTGDLFIAVLQSRTAEDRLIDRFDLLRVYRVKLYKDARKTLEKNSEIAQDRKSGIISINVVDKDPRRAAEIANQYVAELDRLMAQLSTSSARRERVFLEERLKVVKQDLDRTSKEFSEFSSKNATLDIKEQGKAMVEAAAMLQGQLIAAESELRGFEQIYTPNNVRVKSLQARVAELKKQLDIMGGKEGGDSNAPAQDDTLYPSIRKLPLLGVKYGELLRQAKINEAVFETLTKEYEIAKVQEAKEIPTVKVLDPADVPEKAAGPPRLIIMILGTLASAAFAIVLIVGKHHWDGLPIDDPRKSLGVEVLGEARRLAFMITDKPGLRFVHRRMYRKSD